MANKVNEHQVVNLDKYTLDHFIRFKKVQNGFVKYQVKLKELKNPVCLWEKDFQKEEDYQSLIKYKCKVSGEKSDGNEEYCDVEKIVSHRIVPETGKRVYLVQWVGFSHPVWRSELPSSELESCKDKIKEYQAWYKKEFR